VSAVVANFKTNETNDKNVSAKIQTGGYINSLNMCSCHINYAFGFRSKSHLAHFGFLFFF